MTGKNAGDDPCECKSMSLATKVAVVVDVDECVPRECITEKG